MSGEAVLTIAAAVLTAMIMLGRAIKADKAELDGVPTSVLFFLFAFIIVFYPLVVIWGANTLFVFGIPYTFKTWLAALALWVAFGRRDKQKEVSKS